MVGAPVLRDQRYPGSQAIQMGHVLAALILFSVRLDSRGFSGPWLTGTWISVDSIQVARLVQLQKYF